MDSSSGDVIVIIGNGEMGCAVAEALRRRGARVRTSLRGRGGASRERVGRLGLEVIDDEDELLRDAAFVLSIVPPGQAQAVAQRMAGPLSRAAQPPIYADCNAVAPETSCAIGEIIAQAGARYIDASIIGGAPLDRTRANSARIFASGPDARALLTLDDRYGVEVIALDGPLGAASALKMCYAGLTKGLTALGSAIVLSAARYRTSGALKTELARSAAGILNHLTGTIPALPRKAYRFVAEMEEIARFVGAREAGSGMYEGAAALYRHIAAECEGASGAPSPTARDLLDFCAKTK